jgi:hypothetical protein
VGVTQPRAARASASGPRGVGRKVIAACSRHLVVGGRGLGLGAHLRARGLDAARMASICCSWVIWFGSGRAPARGGGHSALRRRAAATRGAAALRRGSRGAARARLPTRSAPRRCAVEHAQSQRALAGGPSSTALRGSSETSRQLLPSTTSPTLHAAAAPSLLSVRIASCRRG